MKEVKTKLAVIFASIILFTQFISAKALDALRYMDGETLTFIVLFVIIFALARFSLNKLSRGQRGFPSTIIAGVFALLVTYLTIFQFNISLVGDLERILFDLSVQMESFYYWGGSMLFIGSWAIIGLFVRRNRWILSLGAIWLIIAGVFSFAGNISAGINLAWITLLVAAISFGIKWKFPPKSEVVQRKES